MNWRPPAKWLRRGAWALGGLLLLWIVIWLGAPPLLKWQGEARLGEALGRPVHIGRVSLRPWSLSLEVHEFKVAGAAGAALPLLQVKRLQADLSAQSLWRLAPVLESLQVDSPQLALARTAEGRYDVDDLVARFAQPPQEPKADEGPPRFALYNLQLRDGRVRFDDRPMGRVHEVRELLLTLPFLSGIPSQVKIKVEPRLAFRLDGTAFDTGAQSTPFAPDRDTLMSLRMGKLDLAQWRPYLPRSLPVQLQRGSAQADLQLHFAVAERQQPALSLRGLLQADDVALADRGGAPLARWKSLRIGLDDVQPLARRVALGVVRAEGLVLSATRDAQGRLNLLQLAAPSVPEPPLRPAAASAASSALTPTPQAGWQVKLTTLELADSRLEFSDATLQPAATLSLAALQARLGPFAWPNGKPAPLTLQAQLVAGGSEAALGRLQLQGEGNEQRARVGVQVDELALPAFAPWLATTLVPRVEGRAALQGTLDWQASPALARLSLKQLQVAPLRVLEPAASATARATTTTTTSTAPRATLGARAVRVARAVRGDREAPPDALSWAALDVGDTEIDLLARRVQIGRLQVRAPQVSAERDAAGRLNFAQWLRPAPAAAPASAAPAAPAASAPAWQLTIAQAGIEQGRVRWRDAAARPAAAGASAPRARLDLSALQLRVSNLAYPAGSTPAQVTLDARVADPAAPRAQRERSSGRLAWQGRVGLQPFAMQGQLQLERFPLHAIEPYVDTGLHLRLQRALASWRGPLALRQGPSGLSLDARGDALLADLHVFPTDPETGALEPDELLSWQSLQLPGVQVAMAPATPLRVTLGPAVLSDFYSRLVVTEDGHFNLLDVRAPAGAPPTPPGGFAVGRQIAAAPPASAPAAAPPAAPASAPAFELRSGGLQLVNGRIDYTDRFVKPNYSAALSQLNGRLGAFSSTTAEMAPLELQGLVAGTGQLQVRGSLNPSATPLALDVGAKASELELAPLSPYAGKYAGYAIERGKLSMDVHYRVQPDGRLEASNRVVLNQLTFGERIDSPEATKLPVRLAVALLKDRNGVIDVNLPVSGSLNDPQFSVASVVLKVIGNLIAKAVTAPFALLTGIGGSGGEDLSWVAFQPGSTQLADGAQATLDRVAQALKDRPALQMTVTGAADPLGEAEAMRSLQLEQRLLALRRQRGTGAAAPASAAAALPAEERTSLLRTLYRETELPDKPRNFIGLQRDLPEAEMAARLKRVMVVSEDSARTLALQRGVAVRDALIARGLPSERLFLAAPALRAPGEGDADWSPRVKLSLAMR